MGWNDFWRGILIFMYTVFLQIVSTEFSEFGRMYCGLWSQYIKVRKLFKGGNYSQKYGMWILLRVLSLTIHWDLDKKRQCILYSKNKSCRQKTERINITLIKLSQNMKGRNFSSCTKNGVFLELEAEKKTPFLALLILWRL